MSRLRRVDCSAPGIIRRRRGRGFEYREATGQAVQDPETLARIRELAIPPAWRDVWICPHPGGHIQAIGTDAAGRKQYLYHPKWRARRDQEKFEHMLEFAKALPQLRARCGEHLAASGLTKRRVLACATRLLDIGFFRIGTEDYAEQNETFGIATIKKRHVKLEGSFITFDYAAKGGKRRIVSIADPQVVEVVTELKKRRAGGPELLSYLEDGRWSDVKSSDINLYIKEVTGRDFSAKDFRTWSATVLAAVGLATWGRAAATKTARDRAISQSIKDVAEYLGNTPPVCRASYIDPRVFDRYRSGWTIDVDAVGDVETFGQPSFQGAIEEAVIDLLEERTESDALEKIA